MEIGHLSNRVVDDKGCNINDTNDKQGFCNTANNVSGKMTKGFGLNDLQLLSVLVFHSFLKKIALQLFALWG